MPAGTPPGDRALGRGARPGPRVGPGRHARCVVETVALGTIGAAAGQWGAAGALPADYAVPVVNADNLIALDLRGLMARHREAAAAFTVATHLQPFRIPFGEVEVVDGRLVAYHEKPDHPVRVSSGTYAPGPWPWPPSRGERCDAPTLVTRLLGRGEVGGWGARPYATPWIDVNDAALVVRAEALVAAHPEAFERWASPPDRVVAGVVLRAGEEMLLEFRPASACYPDLWDTPGGKVEAGEHPAAAAARELREGARSGARRRGAATRGDLRRPDPAFGRGAPPAPCVRGGRGARGGAGRRRAAPRVGDARGGAGARPASPAVVLAGGAGGCAAEPAAQDPLGHHGPGLRRRREPDAGLRVGHRPRPLQHAVVSLYGHDAAYDARWGSVRDDFRDADVELLDLFW